MIILKRKEDCCGCHACETVCPAKCISMRADSEGFLYPETDASRCIGCGLCERVCPVIGAPERVAAATGTPLGTLRRGLAKDFLDEPKVFAARCASDELRMASASGGAFTVLAERVIRRGGVVFGARWNEDFTEVFHAWTETLDGLAAFRGSKYLQSRIGNAFAKTREFLRAGREVMFTGTPCQIAGLRRALRRDFPNLLAVDIACHSVPSPSVWRAFFAGLRERAGIGVPVTNVLFRKKVFDARRGAWNCSTLAVETASGTAFSAPLYSTSFGKGFGSGLFSRPSCHECPAKNRTSGSDLTLGDFWGAEKYFPDLKSSEGLSVVVCNTERGLSAFDEARSAFNVLREASWAQAVPANGGLKNETRRNPARDAFFAEFLAAGTPERAADAIRKFTKTPFPRRVRAFAFRCARFALARTGTLALAKKLFNTKNHEEQNTDISGTIHQLLRAVLPCALQSNSLAILRRLRALVEKRDKTSTPPPPGLKDSSVSWTRISGDDLSLEFEYKDETWNEIVYLNERRMILAQKGKFFPMPDNACGNTRVEFRGDSFRVESHERIPNRWVMLCGKYAQGSVYAVEYDFRTDSDFTEIQFAFNYRNIAERVRLMVVDNRELIFQTVEKGAFIRPTKTRPWRFEHGRTYHVRIEVRGDVFSYIVDGEPLMTLRVPEFLAAREDDSFALIFWEKDDVRPISAEIRNFRVFRGNEIASKTYTNR